MKLVLGTAQFGLPYGIANQAGQVARSEAREMLRLAATNGIDTLDTAIAYGESEACLGEVGVQDFKLITKLPAVPEHCAGVCAWVQEQFAASLARLRVKTVYALLLHRPDQLLGTEGGELYQVMQGLKEAGLVQKMGVSIYAPSELDVLTQQYRFDLVQAPFNLIDRRLFTSGWLYRLKDEGVEIHTRSVFLQGLLLMPQTALPAKFAPWADLWGEWYAWQAQHNVSPAQACLALPFSFPEIDHVIVGADSVTQLEQIISLASNVPSVDLPNLVCGAENLINPARWNTL